MFFGFSFDGINKNKNYSHEIYEIFTDLKRDILYKFILYKYLRIFFIYLNKRKK